MHILPTEVPHWQATWGVVPDDVVRQEEEHSRQIRSCVLVRVVQEVVVDDVLPIILAFCKEFRRQVLLVIVEESKIKLVEVAAHCSVEITHTTLAQLR